MLDLRVRDGGPWVFRAMLFGLDLEGESRVASEETIASLRGSYPPPPPPPARAWPRTLAQRSAQWMSVTPGAGWRHLEVRHRIAGVQRGTAAFRFRGTLREGLRPRLTGTISPDLQACVVAGVSVVFVVAALVVLPTAVLSTAAADEPHWSVVAFLAVWCTFALVAAIMVWRALARGCRQLVANLEAALGGWPLTFTSSTGPLGRSGRGRDARSPD